MPSILLDQLAEYYGPDGEGNKIPCPGIAGQKCYIIQGFGSCSGCNGTGHIFDTDNPFFKALWERRYEVVYIKNQFLLSASHEIDRGYSRRPRAEAILHLLEIPAEIRFERRSPGVVAFVRLTPSSVDHAGYGLTCRDAFCDAMLNSLGVEAEGRVR